MDDHKRPRYEIEVFPKIDSYHWGLASKGIIPDETKAQCTSWSVDVRFSSEDKAPIHAYYHGSMPTIDERISINQQIATFFYGRVASSQDHDERRMR